MPECSDPGCQAFRFDLDAALREGWHEVDEAPYCPLHGGIASRRARQAAQIEAWSAGLRKQTAKKELAKGDYQAWDKFQSDLADYHKRHGRLAHPAVRTLDHRQWLQIHRATGPIDVEEAVRHTEAAEEARNSERERLARGL
jgi:hypothetical protein